jgi:hypothetical protein
VEETTRTLALLLPETADKTKEFFEMQRKGEKKKKDNRVLDLLATKCGTLKTPDRRIQKFEFWQERLEILKQVFNDEEPANIIYWLRDRRKKVQWCTFWVALWVLS